jgi:hypothetical protein
MPGIWIIGGGKFGLVAAEALGGRAADLLIVEKDPARCRELESRGYSALCADGAGFLAARLQGPAQRVWIVASVPVHLAYEWVRLRCAGGPRIEPVPMPEEVARRLPHPFPGGAGQLFASNAGFICPPDCSEPGRTCAATGRRRPRSMHAFIRQIHAGGVKILVVRSHQLAPGVGALRPKDLFEALRQIESAAAAVVLATACKCHAVLNSFKIQPGCAPTEASASGPSGRPADGSAPATG